jgi:hypothetical protein
MTDMLIHPQTGLLICATYACACRHRQAAGLDCLDIAVESEQFSVRYTAAGVRGTRTTASRVTMIGAAGRFPDSWVDVTGQTVQPQLTHAAVASPSERQLMQVAPALQSARLAVCQACPDYTTVSDKCRLMGCSCPVAVRAGSTLGACPAGKWKQPVASNQLS